MRRSTLNFVVDLITLVVMFGMIATGLVIRFVLPPGTGGRYGGLRKLLWGLDRHEWGDVHFWLSVGLGGLLLIHVALHWAWVCNTARRFVRGRQADERSASPGMRNLYGAGLLAAIGLAFAAFLWLTSASAVTTDAANEHRDVNAPPPGSHRESDGESRPGSEHDGERDTQHWGRQTLQEIEAESGVPATFIRERLGLPASTPLNERLGRLSNQPGSAFEPSDVRTIIEEYRRSAAPRAQE